MGVLVRRERKGSKSLRISYGISNKTVDSGDSVEEKEDSIDI